jgi:DNA-directed RNA polymerase specialized sigma24 family protein
MNGLSTMAEQAELEDLVVEAAGENELAWKELWCTIERPLAQMIAQPSFLGRLGGLEDDRQNIVLAVMARLRADRLHRLRLYIEARRANPQLRFMSWLRVVAKRVGIDYLRAHPEYIRRTREDASRPGQWVQPEPLPPSSQGLGQRPPMTDLGTAHQLLVLAAELPGRQRRALEMWVHDQSFDAIADSLALTDAAEARRVVRAALERLRRHVRAEHTPR